MQIDALCVVSLLAANHQLIILDRDCQVGHRKASDGECDAQRVLASLLDIVWRIAVGGSLVDAIERPLEMLEAEQQRRVEQRNSRHRVLLVRASDTLPGPQCSPRS